jgi:hypothetical protein
MSDINLDDILAKHRESKDYSKPDAQSSFDSLLDRLDSDLFSMGTVRRPEKSVTTVSPVLDTLRDEIASLKDIAAGSEAVEVPEKLPEVEVELPSLDDYRFTSRERIARFESQTEATQSELNATPALPEVRSSIIPKQVPDTPDPLDSFTPEAIKRFMMQTDVLFDSSGKPVDPNERPAILEPVQSPEDEIFQTAPLDFSGGLRQNDPSSFGQIAPTQVLAPISPSDTSNFTLPSQVLGGDQNASAQVIGASAISAPVAVPGDDDFVLPSIQNQAHGNVQSGMSDVAQSVANFSSPVLVPDDVLSDHLVTNNAMVLDTSTVFAPTSVPPSSGFDEQTDSLLNPKTRTFSSSNVHPSDSPADSSVPQSIVSQSGSTSESASLAKLTVEPAGAEVAPEGEAPEARVPNRINLIFAASLTLFVIVGIIAAVVFFTVNKPEPVSDGPPEQSQTTSNDSNQIIKRQAPLFFNGGQGYVIFVDPNASISKLKFDSTLEAGDYDVRNTTVSKPLSGEVLASGALSKTNEVSFSEQKFSTIVIVFKDIPQGDKNKVQLTNVSVE